MTENLTKKLQERPEDVQTRTFSLSPQYYSHKAYEDKIAILVSMIRIWNPNERERDWFTIPSSCLVIRECESVEITDSTKDLLGKAVVRFPRGTLIQLSGDMSKKVVSGNSDDQTQTESELRESTDNADLITTSTAISSDDKVPTTPMAVNYDEKGLIDFNRKEGDKDPSLLSPDNVAIGNRIEIRLGYAYSEQEFEKLNASDGSELDIAFTGFITAISVTTPLEIECTNMAHVFKCISTPDIPAKNSYKVKQFFGGSEGKFDLLKNTGIELAENCKESDISVFGTSVSDNLTVADVLESWEKSGVRCMMDVQKDGKVKLKVGLGYYTGLSTAVDKDDAKFSALTNDKKMLAYKGGDKSVKMIQFDWDVAKDGLSLKNTDKKYLAVEATGRTKDGQIFKLTVRKNPDIEDGGWLVDDSSGNFQVVNKQKVKPRKKAKVIGGTTKTLSVDHKLVDKSTSLDKYVVVPYVSTKVGITEKELEEEAKKYWASYSPNGISGSLVIFGDVMVRPSDIVGLIDIRQPEKNGYYYVESVNTEFGVDGYRRELKLPLKVASFKQTVTTI